MKGDPVVRFVKDNKSVCNFRVSTMSGKGYATNHRCVAWDELAGKAGEYRDGDRVSVHGYIKYGSYTDKEGKKCYTTDIVVLGTAKEKADAPQKNAVPMKADVQPDDDDIPF
jgi:single-strand DNA-binding protein